MISEAIAQTLVRFWEAQGLSVPAGCDQATIKEFERVHGVTLPPDMRAYLSLADGMNQTFKDSCDKDGFAFYPLDLIESVPTFGRRFTSPLVRFSSDDDFFVFADYLQLSWAYAIRIRGEGNRVLIVGKQVPEIVAESFEDFVGLYVLGSPVLYTGVPLVS